MKFWDASAIVPLLVAEELTRRLQALAAKDLAFYSHFGLIICRSAIASLAAAEGVALNRLINRAVA